MIIVNDWNILAHPLFLDQLEKLVEVVENLKVKKPDDYQKNANTKLLFTITKLVFETIPSDPTATLYRQGSTLGDGHKHWFRAKFGNGRFRLFFRYDTRSKVLIFAWVNDETTLRTYGSKNDAYKIFKGMLDNGNPPDDWNELLKASSDDAAAKRLQRISSTKV